MAQLPFKWCLLASLLSAAVAYWLTAGLWSTVLTVLVSLVLSASLGGWDLYAIIATIPRDSAGAIFRVKLVWELQNFSTKTRTIPRAFQHFARKHPNKACFIFEKQTYTFERMDQLSTKIAIVLRDQLHFKPDEVLGLLMPNKPEYVATWLGAAKLGSVTALLNTNVRFESLLHSIKAVKCRALLFDAELASNVKEVLPSLKEAGVETLIQWQADGTAEFSDCYSMQREIEAVEANGQSAVRDFQVYEGKPTDPLVYIYTSGTTGMPKAALVRQRRCFQVGIGAYLVCRMSSDDIVYCPLPLYHTAGGLIGAGCALSKGVTVVLRTKFSASQYWDECIYYKCTVAQYIGEMCRYLLAQPEKASDSQHSIRYMLGNGMRAKIWQQFIDRFHTTVLEIYGSTEGNANLVNFDGTVGACGVVSIAVPMELAVIRCDRESGEPVRDKQGMCIRCDPDEPGQLVGIIDTSSTLADFAGYTDKKSSEKKVLRDVLTRGDAAFASGDILRMDRFGYVYFVDRIGDTFRWKGENVSTTEVESVLSQILGMDLDVIVYGVELPGCEGRAGMASITGSDLTSIGSPEFFEQVEKRLPFYARPIFIRVVQSVEATGTMKLKKGDLRSLGFASSPNDLQLYYLNVQAKKYDILTEQVRSNIISGKIRL